MSTHVENAFAYGALLHAGLTPEQAKRATPFVIAHTRDVTDPAEVAEIISDVVFFHEFEDQIDYLGPQ